MFQRWHVSLMLNVFGRLNMPAMDPRSSSLQFRVACMFLAQAEQELRKAGNPLAGQINQFLQGVLDDMEAK